jgi:hypothetical protein
MTSCGKKLMILGGQQDTGKSAARRWRKDVLVFDSSRGVWEPPVKNALVPSKACKDLVGEHVLVSGELAYILYRGSSASRTNPSEELLFIDRVYTR